MSFLGATLLTCATVAVMVAGSCPQAELGLCLGAAGCCRAGEAGARSASAAAGPPPTTPVLLCSAPSREGCKVKGFLHSSGKFKHFLVLVFF